MKFFRDYLRALIRRHGYDIVKYSCGKHPLARRIKLLEHYKVKLLLDVGANIGQYAQQVRSIGYSGRIESFEPIRSAYEELKFISDADTSWNIHNIALGDADSIVSINVSENSQSSSLLEMLPSHRQAFPESVYVSTEQVVVNRLDSIFNDLWQGESGVYLKIDAQGFEKNIIEGAAGSLDKIDTIQLEMSLRPLYSGEPLFREVDSYMNDIGYMLVSVETSWADKISGELLQLDGIYHKKDVNIGL